MPPTAAGSVEQQPAPNRDSARLTVVKLGGSLLRSDQLDRWLRTIAAAGRGITVVVPGGGPFADVVREAQARWAFDEATAHHLAILAMEQYGRMMAALEPFLLPAGTEAEIQAALGQEHVAVWMPTSLCLGRPEIPESWDVTSDSLALWLAERLGAGRAILIKAKTPPLGSASCAALTESGLVDAAFDRFLSRARVRTFCLGPDQQDALAEALTGRYSGACEVLGDVSA